MKKTSHLSIPNILALTRPLVGALAVLVATACGAPPESFSQRQGGAELPASSANEMLLHVQTIVAHGPASQPATLIAEAGQTVVVGRLLLSCGWYMSGIAGVFTADDDGLVAFDVPRQSEDEWLGAVAFVDVDNDGHCDAEHDVVLFGDNFPWVDDDGVERSGLNQDGALELRPFPAEDTWSPNRFCEELNWALAPAAPEGPDPS